jgi:hypothetical protein
MARPPQSRRVGADYQIIRKKTFARCLGEHTRLACGRRRPAVARSERLPPSQSSIRPTAIRQGARQHTHDVRALRCRGAAPALMKNALKSTTVPALRAMIQEPRVFGALPQSPASSLPTQRLSRPPTCSFGRCLKALQGRYFINRRL